MFCNEKRSVSRSLSLYKNSAALFAAPGGTIVVSVSLGYPAKMEWRLKMRYWCGFRDKARKHYNPDQPLLSPSSSSSATSNHSKMSDQDPTRPSVPSTSLSPQLYQLLDREDNFTPYYISNTEANRFPGHIAPYISNNPKHPAEPREKFPGRRYVTPYLRRFWFFPS